MKKFCFVISASLLCLVFAQDDCTKSTKTYNNAGFSDDDFLAGGQGLLFGPEITPDPGGEIDTENIVFTTNQPFYSDYQFEGAGASHLFGFFFMDIDTNKNGFPDFFEIDDQYDLDGDGLTNDEDNDDDGDGIPDGSDNAAAMGLTMADCMDPADFRNGTAAAAAGATAGDYWQYIPNGRVGGFFEHPGAYLYLDTNDNQIPDILEYDSSDGIVPAYVVDQGFTGLYNGGYNGEENAFPGALGVWPINGENYWTGSTIFYIADDDGGTGQTGHYGDHSPYGLLYSDVFDNQNGQPDYLIYGTSDESSAAIPDELKVNDPDGVRLWRYRWDGGTVSGGREFVFFLVVFWGSGGSDVNTYYSKSGFNQDSPSGNPTGNTTGDNYGGAPGLDNWIPRFRDTGDHDTLAQAVFGQDWDEIATSPTDDTDPVALNPANQDWVDRWANWNGDRRIIQYRGLADWFGSAAGVARVNSRYGIDLTAEGDSSLIRAINGNFAHLMVGAPSAEPEAWLLGWEDLFAGGDRDFEDVVFYVKREARGSAQSLNVASDLDNLTEDEVSITQVSFEFEDNWTSDLWGVEGNYINYFYRLDTTSDWIPLLGGEHLGDPNLFDLPFEESGGRVRRTAVLNVPEAGKKEVYWMVEMNTNDVSVFVPEVYEANVGYEALVHAFFYNSASLASSNVEYYGGYETPDATWREVGKNRGHLYAWQTFNHGVNLTVSGGAIPDPEDTPETHPPSPFFWDAGVSMLSQIGDGFSNRNLFTWLKDDMSADFSNNLTRYNFDFSGLDPEVVNALDLDGSLIDGLVADNFHDPAAGVLEPDEAGAWLAAWTHGFFGVIPGENDTGFPREWILGGINRAGPLIVRSPGIPAWITGTDIPTETKQEFITYIKTANVPTRIIMGSEAGILHCFDAGLWNHGKEDASYEFADGFYSNFGTGEEVWGIIPSNFLDDLKFNYTGRSSTSAKIDTTGVQAVINNSGTWRRVGVFAQGLDGGEYNGRTGNVIFSLDISDPDNPQPLWEYSNSKMGDILYPLAIYWSKWAGGNRWITALSTGSAPSLEKPAVIFLDAYTGEELAVVEFGNDGDVIAGAPALLPEESGFAEFAYIATSGGDLVAINLETLTVSSLNFENQSFYLTPNVVTLGSQSLLSLVSGDNPLTYDAPSNVQNYVYGVTHDKTLGTFDVVGTFALDPGHRAFSRPRILGEGLLLGTTTGDTYSFCDPDPDDPGNIYYLPSLYTLNDLDPGDPSSGFQVVYGFGPVLAPIVVQNGVARFRRSFGRDSNQVDAEGNELGQNRENIISAPSQTSVVGEHFGILGWEEPLMDATVDF